MEHLGSLDLFLRGNLLARLGILLLLLNVLDSRLCSKLFLVFLDLYSREHLLSVCLGLLHCCLRELLLLHLRKVDLFKDRLMLGLDGVLSVLTALGGLFKLLSLLLSLLNDHADELGSLLDGHFHLDIEGGSDLGRLSLDEVRSPLSGSGQSLLSGLSDFFW